jgi:hypothetical protein
MKIQITGKKGAHVDAKWVAKNTVLDADDKVANRLIKAGNAVKVSGKTPETGPDNPPEPDHVTSRLLKSEAAKRDKK